jgi:hypothetical protein
MFFFKLGRQTGAFVISTSINNNAGRKAQKSPRIDKHKVNTMTGITYDVTCMLTLVPVSGSECFKPLMFVT